MSPEPLPARGAGKLPKILLALGAILAALGAVMVWFGSDLSRTAEQGGGAMADGIVGPTFTVLGWGVVGLGALFGIVAAVVWAVRSR